MGDVSEYDDDADRPEQQAGPGPDERPDHEAGNRAGDPGGDLGDTQPLGGSSYPPPLPSHPEPQREPAAPEQPAPHSQPYGQQPTSTYPTQPQPAYGYAPYPPPVRQAGHTSRFPTWAWVAMTAVALVVGTLGGVIGGVAVSSSMSSGVSPVTVIGTDNGASAPLDATNGSVAAVAKKLLPSTVQIQAKGGADPLLSFPDVSTGIERLPGSGIAVTAETERVSLRPGPGA